ncbi:SDR family NAD(P)-dependent oxidoreductase (plasmid) [Rhizobium sp. T136]|uniref:Short-chain dehydrogenase/reductase SDR n=2 Tax=Rhizobium favelukesii TaxID=348824 RepID=W6RQW6_9HYPH|nr:MULTISPECIES: SDR family NAD(P)-dependent oxidoreductase [Rhizobium]UFS79051.1 SDR family NAD(P)-dependent oxidoreductase [Rhizobium sp. T136]CDM62545.1 short-chain dehydrogenase/reductase SDR [Rhizobium favelukesii]
MSYPKTVVMTGATNGIGRIAAIKLAGMGNHLILIARNQAKAEAMRLDILQTIPDARIDFFYADFTRLSTVAEAARAIGAKYERIDVLINNAGIHAFKQRVTSDGFPEMVSVNYIAPWLLTAKLSDRLVASAPSRIVTVASEASRRSKGLTPDADLHDITPFTRLGSSAIYGRTKLMDVMFSMELARRLASTGVTANCLDPGFNVTGLGRELSFAAPLERFLNFLRVGDPNRGAGIIIALAMARIFAEVTGGYFSVKNAAPLILKAPGGDVDARRRLWDSTARAVEAFDVSF